MKSYYKADEEYGLPAVDSQGGDLFLPQQEERAEKVLSALSGLRVCTALALLKKCEQALLQSTVDVD